MFEIVKAGGPVMVPIILASIIAAAIFLERLWTLAAASRRACRTDGQGLEMGRAAADHRQAHPCAAAEFAARQDPGGRAWPIAIVSAAIIKESIEDAGRHVVHELDRFINALGTIASVSPLLGLLGTVIGMIRTFNALSTAGAGNPMALAGGIAEALITTAAGLTVAIPALLAYKYLRGRVTSLVVQMEKEAISLVQAIEGAGSV